MAIYATSILKDPMLRVAKLGVLNAHTSILPDYRGTRAEFWQALHDDHEKVGVTVHFVNAGVDTGDIVLQRRSDTPSGTDPYTMRIHNVLIARDLLPMAICSVIDGTVQRTPQRSTSMPTWRARDITLEKKVELLRKLGFACRP
jgi:methionyl-tRNA formyltransferase